MVSQLHARVKRYLNESLLPIPAVTLESTMPRFLLTYKFSLALIYGVFKPKVLVIASSTGGPDALDKVLSKLRPAAKFRY